MKITLARVYGRRLPGLTNSRLLLNRKHGGPGFWRRLPTVNGFYFSIRSTTVFVELWRPSSRSKRLIIDHRPKRERLIHDATDSDCRYWTGDRAGYDLTAVCRPCTTRAK